MEIHRLFDFGSLSPRSDSSRPSPMAWLTVCVALVWCSGGCAKKSPPKVEEAEPVAAQAQEPVQIPSDPVEAAIFNVVTYCTFNEQHAVISRCDNNEKQTAIRDFNTGKISRVEAFPKLVDALASSDKKRSVVAGKLFEASFRNSFGTAKPEDVNKEAASRLIGLLGTLPDRQASQVAPVAVHAAMLTGQQEALYKALDENPSKDLRASAYVYLLRYGTLAELPKIQSLVEGGEERVAASAIEALRRMPGQTPEDVKKVCDFVKPLAEDPRPVVAGKATAQLVTCSGAYLDAALVAAQNQSKQSKLAPPTVRGFDQACVQHRGKSYADDAQCKRLRSLLEQAVADTKLSEETRQFALLGLGLQFPDEATGKLAAKYATSDVQRLKSAADRVTRSVAGKLKKPAGPSGAAVKTPLPLRKAPQGPAPSPQ